MVTLGAVLRSPFSFLFAQSRAEEQVAVYVRREHARGRSLAEVLDDACVRGRLSEIDVARLLDRPDLVHALCQDIAPKDVGQSRQSRPV